MEDTAVLDMKDTATRVAMSSLSLSLSLPSCQLHATIEYELTCAISITCCPCFRYNGSVRPLSLL